jgi:hypothetical protein
MNETTAVKTQSDFRTLCAELVQSLHESTDLLYGHESKLVTHARALLAKSGMINTDWRTLCAELADSLHGNTCLLYGHESKLVARAWAALAEPEAGS